MWTKMGVFSLRPPAQIHLPWLYQPTSLQSCLYFKVSFILKDSTPGGQLHISYMFLWVTEQLFIEQEQIYNGRRVAVWVEGRLSPGTSVLSKASLPWYAQNPLQGCQRFTGSHKAGMLVKTELKRGGVKNLIQAQSPISPRTGYVPKVTWLLMITEQTTLTFVKAVEKQADNISESAKRRLFKLLKKPEFMFMIMRRRDPQFLILSRTVGKYWSSNY